MPRTEDGMNTPAVRRELTIEMNYRTGFGLTLLKSQLVLDDLVELILDKNLLVLDVVANQSGVGDDAAFDELLETDQLAKLALEVELVALICYQVNVALAFVNDRKEFVDVYIAK